MSRKAVMPARQVQRPGSAMYSINFIVRSDVLQQDGLGAFVLDDLEYNPQVVAGTTGPRTCQIAFQLVRFQRRLKSIFHERYERGFEIRPGIRMFLHQPPRRSRKCRRLQQDSRHFMISRIKSLGVVGKQRPSANS